MMALPHRAQAPAREASLKDLTWDKTTPGGIKLARVMIITIHVFSLMLYTIS